MKVFFTRFLYARRVYGVAIANIAEYYKRLDNGHLRKVDVYSIMSFIKTLLSWNGVRFIDALPA